MSTSNLRVIKLPLQISSFRFVHIGAVGRVHKINDRIALKFPRKPHSPEFAYENGMFDILENHAPCPDIVQSFLRLPEGNFLAMMNGNSLEKRLHANQIRESADPYSKLLRVTKKEPTDAVERWIMELSNAAAWLEALRYAHTDIRPANLIFDDEDHLKLADFDSMAPLGSRKEASAPPYARLLGPGQGFGVNGARTEQFAIGSILYEMTRGHEPYEAEEFEDGVDGATIIVDRFRDMEFPPLSQERLDQIIRECWHGEFSQVKDLAEETKTLPGVNKLPRATPLDPAYLLKCRKECQDLVDGGVFLDDYFTQ